MQLTDQEREILNLLDQFGQVILHGPPGTGKTYAARNVAAALLRDNGDATVDIDNNPRFALVQFHPSYNYEDFVRGVQVKTDDGQVVYETVNRVFGQMAEKAASDSDKAFAMVIDEINRANVSAVLGELIYALEYRGKPVKTPYELGGGRELSVPANLKIIGTMNTADRTIGQIDYAVRRRFAFVHCAPDIGIVQSDGGPRATEFFKLVDDVFAHLSPDYDAEDVRIGHSYFLADGGKLARNVIYQVVPILREYLKDGMLTKDAAGMIDEIERRAKEMGKSRGVSEEILPTSEFWRWFRIGYPAQVSVPQGYGPMVLSLVRDYVRREKIQTLAELQEQFPHNDKKGRLAKFPHFVEDIDHPKVQKNMEDVKAKKDQRRFFFKEEERITLGDRTVVVVTNQLGPGGDLVDYADRFKERAHILGYKIYAASRGAIHSPYWYVNTGERRARPHRAWTNCRMHGFVSGGQDDNPDKPQSTASQLKKIPLGAIVFAYHFGYLGFGVVTKEATPIREFPAQNSDGETLADALMIDDVKGDFIPEKEFAVGVDWLSDKSGESGILSRHAYPNTASPIRNSERLRELKRVFGIVGESGDTDHDD